MSCERNVKITDGPYEEKRGEERRGEERRGKEEVRRGEKQSQKGAKKLVLTLQESPLQFVYVHVRPIVPDLPSPGPS